MKLNGLDLSSFAEQANEVAFVFPPTVTPAQVIALDGQTLTITSNDEDYRTYGGYSLMSAGWASQEKDATTGRFFRALSDQTDAAITALDENVAAAQSAAEDAQGTALEAMDLAQAAGTDPQVATIAKLTVSSVDFADVTATDCVAIPDYIPEWADCIGETLSQNDPVKYEGAIYRASQQVLVQEQYDPVTAGESQYYPITVAPDGIIVYRECHGQYDMVCKGEKRHYPDAEGPVYVALEDTAYSPDAYPQHWQLVEGD